MTSLRARSTAEVDTYKLLANGKDITYEYEVLTLVVNRAVNRVPTARVVLKDGDAAEETFEVSDGTDLIPGVKLEIALGLDGKDSSIFKGVITKQAIRVGANGDSTLTLECKENAVLLTLGRHSRYFADSTDSEAIESIIQENYSDLSREIESTSVSHPEIVQYHSTDWDFILSRAEMNGQIVLVNGDTVQVKPPSTQGEPLATFKYGQDLLEFEAEMDARSQHIAVKAKAWNYADQQLVETDATEPTVNKQGNLLGEDLAKALQPSEWELCHGGQVLEPELKAWADAQLLKSRLAKIQARVKVEGCQEVKPDALIQLEGIGDRFSGQVYVSGVRHEIADDAWYTHLQLGLSPQWFYQEMDTVEKPAAGLLPGVNGLQIGVVVQLEEDPDGEDRILVKAPIIDPDAKGTWARIATLDAGDNRGSFFRPEIDDEVVLGFLNDDPRDPIVLGMLNSSAKPAPLQGSNDNHHKGFFTRSEMKVTFDDEKKIIALETPGGNKITVSDEAKGITLEDQNGNTLTMNDSGIEIKSPKDITLEATGKLTLKASQDTSIEGLNVTAKANAQFKAEGSAGAEVSTGAIAILKGSLVQIN